METLRGELRKLFDELSEKLIRGERDPEKGEPAGLLNEFEEETDGKPENGAGDGEPGQPGQSAEPEGDGQGQKKNPWRAFWGL